MSTISEKTLAHASLASADRLLRGYFDAHPGPQNVARVTLRARDREVPAIVTLTPAPRPGDMTPHFRVHWEAASGGIYPVFDGDLSVGADEDYDTFWLVVDGTYTPPGGLVGQVFDAVIGHAIAQETARGLLEEMRAAIEAHVAQEEANKPRA